MAIGWGLSCQPSFKFAQFHTELFCPESVTTQSIPWLSEISIGFKPSNDLIGDAIQVRGVHDRVACRTQEIAFADVCQKEDQVWLAAWHFRLS